MVCDISQMSAGKDGLIKVHSPAQIQIGTDALHSLRVNTSCTVKIQNKVGT